jgi:nucleotide-binding universal stress UspA family protein
MLVGPQARPPCADDAPVVVAVDGTRDDRTVVRIAGEWARRMRWRLVVVTVAEPAPRPFRSDRQVRRSRGPADPEAYVAHLAADVGAGAANTVVDVRVVYDPISVRNGVARLVDRTASLLVLGTHRRTRALRAVLGSHAARIVHDIEVPALVVPLDAGG